MSFSSLIHYIQYGAGRGRRLQAEDAKSAQSGTDEEEEDEAEDDDDDDVSQFCRVVGVWERGGSRSRSTRTETIDVRFSDWQRARRPDRLLSACIQHLMERVLAGRTAPIRVGLSCYPPGWDNAFHLPLRPPAQNTASALAAALEAFAKAYDALDLFSGDVRFRISAVLPLEPASDAGGGCADSEREARGSVRCASFVPVVNGGRAQGGDRWCMARAVLFGLADRHMRVRQRLPREQFRAHCAAEQGAAGAAHAQQLLQAVGLPLDLQLYGAREVQHVQQWLNAQLGAGEVRLVLFEREAGFRIVWKGNAPARFNLCLVLQDAHYGYIQRPEHLFHARQYCVDCESVVDQRSHPHGCKALCSLCFRFGWGFPCQRRCGDDVALLRCADCAFVFPNADCMAAHRRVVDPAPPGWEHDRRYGRRPRRSMCVERRICAHCRQIVWTRAGAHQCPQQPAANNNNGQQQLQCQICRGPHDPMWTPHFIQPRRFGRQYPLEEEEQQQQREGADNGGEEEEEQEADSSDDEEEVPRVRRRGKKPLRFLFWDVESAQVPVQQPDNQEDGGLEPVLKHVPVLLCAEVICERCIAAGVDVEREPERRAPGCVCGVPWRGPNRRLWAMRVGEDAFSDQEEEEGADGRPQQQMPADERNPRRLRFFRDPASGKNAIELYADFLLHTGPINVCTLILAHNGGRYDVHLLLEELQRRGAKPKRLISTGLRVYSLELGGRNQRQVIAKDTLNFYGCALSKLPATFGLSGVAEKPFFPYMYIQEANMDVRLRGLPPRAAYDPDRMRPAEHAAFMRWYEQQPADRLFVLRRELLRYCANDVRILRAATLRFREIIGQLAGGMEPFMAASTIAGLAMSIYRQCHLPPNTMVHTPEGGFLRRRHASVASRRFFALLQWRRPEWRIRTAQWSIGEECVEDDGYRLDALVNLAPPLRPLAIEFNGCYYHGCRECYPRRAQKLAGGQSAELLHARTLQRVWELEHTHGYRVESVWECKFRELLRRNARLRKAYAEKCRTVPAPLDLRRDALFGGRVEPFALHYQCQEGEEIEYLDIVSLYPFVMKYREFPVGMPQVVTAEALRPGNQWGQEAALPWTRPADNPYKGFLLCRVLPPTPAQLGAHHTLLPYRTAGGRLTFPLCAACAEAGNADKRRARPYRPLRRCRHADAKRAWMHAFTHTELNAALALGYRVVELHEVWNYAQWASQEAGNSLFASYVDTLMRIKVEASGWPPGCVTPEQRAAYVRDYAEREGIHIDPARVEYNPGLRAVAKALLNSLWGKFAQRAERDEVRYTGSAREFHDLFTDPTQEVVDFVHINELMDRSVVRKRHPFVRAPPTNNLAVACFVTSHARVYLHERLEEVRRAGGRMLYADTDSAMFVKRRGAAPLPSEGDALGQLKREMPGRRNVRFVCGGPKNWATLHVDAESGEDERAERKIRGLVLTHTASQMLPFRRMCRLILNFFGRRVNGEQRVRVPYSRFVRTKRAEIHTRRTTKLYQPVYTKGLVVAVPPDAPAGTTSFFTRPFGWYDD